MRNADPDRVIRAVGRRIAELRLAADETQEKLAERARFSVSYLQRIEGGRQALGIRSLVRFANVLGVTVGELFVASSSPTPARLRRATRGRGRSR